MEHSNKLAAASMVAFIVLSLGFGSVICLIGSYGAQPEHCTIHAGVATCTSAANG